MTNPTLWPCLNKLDTILPGDACTRVKKITNCGPPHPRDHDLNKTACTISENALT